MRLMQEGGTHSSGDKQVFTSLAESLATSPSSIEDVKDPMEGSEAEFLSISDLICLYFMKSSSSEKS